MTSKMHLLDTCVLLWMAVGGAQLSVKAKAAVFADGAVLGYSSISALEIERLVAVRRIALSCGVDAWLAQIADTYQLREFPVDSKIAALSARLSPIHRDPCDRIIIATATTHKLSIITPDTEIKKYPCLKVIW